ncbi:bifunctional UDP-N-acetylglucosamine diphosphorylase/glucosamine-1-phosphate N-acetyltransferase GlmU [Gilvimarinus agarilyticus]|uniref:bifunctional UDP-N-acetylglucosamine diphosphorylase/glucosamine-1-phosphate N-acetyltransferase GlmU n=1 Tax=Gilvimarinus agarilyticus TaxID=679259 RepID=UPI00059F61CE|nr:bifunctional UDP-N-acetylglucosamine diphosphorylase/glucosamine-1-phosphate N-acetyltransferase GlmU [Gilvimarinus agarilyticus]
MLDVVILAAGKGTRMNSNLPKVLHSIAGKPMLHHVLDTVDHLSAGDLQKLVVVGHGAEQVEASISGRNCQCVTQAQQLGTGHAVQQVLPQLRDDALVLILYADVPLITPESLTGLLECAGPDTMGLLTVNLLNPTGYGRILRNDAGDVIAIVEEKDASAEQKQIGEVNTGIMAVPAKKLIQWLPELSNDNAQGEYYLTDIIAKARQAGTAIQVFQPASAEEVEGVNNRRQQAKLERIYQQAQADALLDRGVYLADPSRFDCRGELIAGRDVEIDINVVIEGKVELGDKVKIGPNCVISNSVIAANSEIKANSILEDAVVAEGCVIGPYARLRPGTVLKNGAKVGNFVETKKAVIGEGSKVNHLSYIGDCEMGARVNVGAGTITCNYDGVNKFTTTIGDDVFVGSNSALVAPVTLGDTSTVGAGSVVTRDVAADELTVARARQRSITGWLRPVKQPK